MLPRKLHRSLGTGKDPHPKQIVYGEQALDLVFDALGVGNFDLAAFFREEPPNRITTNATVSMIQNRLISLFGNDTQFTEEIIVVIEFNDLLYYYNYIYIRCDKPYYYSP